jgi:hypothetical protein
MPLHEAVDHPELFENYPQLRNTKIRLQPDMHADGLYYHPYSDDRGKEKGDEVVLREPGDRDTLAHETQHAVQYIEGHPTGANPGEIASKLDRIPAVRNELSKAAKELYPLMSRSQFKDVAETNWGKDQPEEALNTRYDDHVDTQDISRRDWIKQRIKQMAFDLYQRAPGEMEARTAGFRATAPTIAPPRGSLEYEKETTEERYPYPEELTRAGYREGSIAYMAPLKAAAKAKLEKPANWDKQPESVRQAYLEEKVAQTLAKQHKGPETHPLVVQRKPDGGIKYDPNGKPVYEKHNYNIVNAPLLGEKALDKIATEKANEHQDIVPKDQHTYLKPIERRRLSAMRNASAVSTMGDKIVESYMGIKDIPAIAAGHGWYSGMRKKLAKFLSGSHQVGEESRSDHELFAQLLGATSAKTPVRNNFIQSLDALEQFRSGAFDRHIKHYLEGYGHLKTGGTQALVARMRELGIPLYEVDSKGNRTYVNDHKTDAAAMANWIDHHGIMPKQKLQAGQTEGAKYNANSLAVLRALAGTWLEEAKAPKTPNFAGNLTGRSLEATIDVWAARHIQRLGYEGLTGGKAWRAQSAAEPGVNALDFAFSQDAMRDAAQKLTKMGIKMKPDDLQAVLWFAEKHHYEGKGWTRGAGAAKSSFDDVADLAFPKSGTPMTSDDLRAHFGAIQKATSQRKARIKTAKGYVESEDPDVQAKLAPYMEKHGLTHEEIHGEPEEEEEDENLSSWEK